MAIAPWVSTAEATSCPDSTFSIAILFKAMLGMSCGGVMYDHQSPAWMIAAITVETFAQLDDREDVVEFPHALGTIIYNASVKT